MTDQEYFLKAEKEFNSNNVNEAIFAKANTLVKGNEKEVKYKYIELRAGDLKKESNQEDKDELISKAVNYGKTGGKIIGVIGLIIASLMFLFIVVYVLPNL